MRLPPVLELADLVEQLNSLGGRTRWTNARLRRLLDAGGVRLRQKKSGTRLYVTRAALAEAFPDFVASLELAQEQE